MAPYNLGQLKKGLIMRVEIKISSAWAGETYWTGVAGDFRSLLEEIRSVEFSLWNRRDLEPETA